MRIQTTKGTSTVIIIWQTKQASSETSEIYLSTGETSKQGIEQRTIETDNQANKQAANQTIKQAKQNKARHVSRPLPLQLNPPPPCWLSTMLYIILKDSRRHSLLHLPLAPLSSPGNTNKHPPFADAALTSAMAAPSSEHTCWAKSMGLSRYYLPLISDYRERLIL